jgi:hypothetical protein
MSPATAIEHARGGLGEPRAREAFDFLSRDEGLNEEAARRWLDELVCVAVEGGRVVGVSAARPASVALIGGRPFWIYRSVLRSRSGERWDELFNSTFQVLDEEFAESDGTYIGLCVLVDDPGLISRRPEAVWPETELMYAGYLDDGRQVRVRYFWGAAVGPGLQDSPSLDETRMHQYPLDERYRILALDETDEVSTEDVIGLWGREGAVPDEEEAARRVREVRLVGIDRDEGVVGVSSLFLRRNEQLRMDLWNYRTYVAADHRRSNLAAQLIFRNRDEMEQRFVRGEDTRAGGLLFELEHQRLQHYFNKALWLPADFTFIGENEWGHHVRIHYFPGATVPVLGNARASGA